MMFLPSVAWGQPSTDDSGDTPPGAVVSFTAAAPVTALAFSPDGQQLLCGSNAGLEIRSWPRLERLRVLPVALDNVHDLQFSPAQDLLLVAGGSPGESGRVQVWSWPELRLLEDLALHDDAIQAVVWAPAGQRFATASFDGTCVVFDWPHKSVVCRFAGHSQPVLSINFWDSQRLLSAGLDQTIRLWDATDGTIERRFDNHVNQVYQVLLPGDQVSKRDRMVSISEDRTVRLWQPEIGRMIRFQKLASAPTTACWLASEQLWVVGCRDGQLWQLQAETLEVERTHATGVGRIHRIVGHPQSGHVVISGNRQVAVYQVAKSFP
jgi:WD40 repeat protein